MTIGHTPPPEHDEVAVCARLRESVSALSTCRMVWLAREERLDEVAALGESLITLPEQVGDLLVEFGVMVARVRSS